MTQALTWIRLNWQSLMFLAAVLFIGFMAGMACTLSEIDSTIADYIEANGCPVEGEDW